MYMESAGKEKTASIHTTWKKSHQWYVIFVNPPPVINIVKI